MKNKIFRATFGHLALPRPLNGCVYKGTELILRLQVSESPFVCVYLSVGSSVAFGLTACEQQYS